MTHASLVGGQPRNNSGHFLVCVYPEALVLGDARQLHVLGIELLLHDLLERLEDERLGVFEGEGLHNKMKISNKPLTRSRTP